MPGEPPRHSTEPATVTAAVELARRPRVLDGQCCGFRHATDVHTPRRSGHQGRPRDSLIFESDGPRPRNRRTANGFRGVGGAVEHSPARVRADLRVRPGLSRLPSAARGGQHGRMTDHEHAATGPGPGSGPVPEAGGGPRDAVPGEGAASAAPHRFRRDRRSKVLAGGVRGARAPVRHGPGDLPDHPRGALRDGRHRPHLLRLRLALRPVRRRGGERGPQALHRPRRRPGPGGCAVRAGGLRCVPVDAEQRECADVRRRPLPAAGGRGVLVAAARRPRPRPAGRAGRRRRTAGGPGAAGGHLLSLLVAGSDRQGRHPRRRHRLSVGSRRLPRP